MEPQNTSANLLTSMTPSWRREREKIHTPKQTNKQNLFSPTPSQNACIRMGRFEDEEARRAGAVSLPPSLLSFPLSPPLPPRPVWQHRSESLASWQPGGLSRPERDPVLCLDSPPRNPPLLPCSYVFLFSLLSLFPPLFSLTLFSLS